MELVQRFDSEGASLSLEHAQGRYYPYSYGYASYAEIIQDLKTFKTRPDDVWLTGAYRSGTHWLREIIGMLQAGNAEYHTKGDEGNVELHGVKAMEKRPSPRLLKVHLTPSFLPTVFTYPDGGKIVHIIRNPKDVAVSLYKLFSSFKTMEYEGNFSGFLPSFMEGQAGNAFSWFEFVKDWWTQCKHHPRVLFLFYENMKTNPLKNIKNIGNFLNLEYSDDFYQEIVDKTLFHNMVKVKQNSAKDRATLKGNTSFMGQGGKAGRWKEMFTVAQNEMFDRRYREEMEDFPDLRERIAFQ